MKAVVFDFVDPSFRDEFYISLFPNAYEFYAELSFEDFLAS